MLSNLLTLGLAATAAASPLRRALPTTLKVTVSAPADVENADNLYAVVELTNTGQDVVEINSFDTAFSPMDTNDFRVDGSAASGQASAPKFVGAIARYVTDPADVRKAGGLIRLAAGESKMINTTLSGRYDFTESGTGTYSIGTAAEFSVIAAGATEFQTVTAAVEPAAVNLKGALVSKRDTGSLDKRAPKFWKCTDPEQLAINLAASGAQNGGVKAAGSLAATSPLYVTWFGAWDTTRAATVRKVYSNMNGVFDRITYDCDCDMVGVWAYIYTTSWDRIYLCPMFWTVSTGIVTATMDLTETPTAMTVPLYGIDSKTSTLIHEVSHWANVGGTIDIEYGEVAAKALAANKPAQAIQNADNYGYYHDELTA